VGNTPFGMIGFTKAFGNTFLRFGALGALFAAAYAYHRNESSDAAALQQAELDHAKLDAQMDEARLQVLQAQIEPHFLFNTLAHVRRLYQTDPKLAHDMLDNLMRYLEVALPQMRERDSTVEREARLAEAYLNIQRIRMGRRLNFEITLPHALRNARIPPHDAAHARRERCQARLEPATRRRLHPDRRQDGCRLAGGEGRRHRLWVHQDLRARHRARQHPRAAGGALWHCRSALARDQCATGGDSEHRCSPRRRDDRSGV